MVRKYPIGLQSFRKIREGGYVYIDKTELIHKLVTGGSYYFLSRPRRFGKSLLVDTLEELFKGSRELFEGLWIEDQWDWSKTNPVIHFNFADIGVHTLGLEKAILGALAKNANRLNVTLSDTSYDQQFKELIEKTSVYGQVVVLIDEYDKPLIDYLGASDTLTEHRSILKNFYSVLKGRDEQIRFLLLTGVSRFSRVSIFSDLNNLEDITIGQNFNNLAGITQRELEHFFGPELESFAAEGVGSVADVKAWYNGYSWGGKDTLYNPFSLLNLMKSREFRNFWYTTGTPTFLLHQLKRLKLGDLDGIRVSENALADFNANDPEPGPLLFQTGYLTIKQRNGQLYELGYPNREVKESLLDGLLTVYRESVHSDSLALVADLQTALTQGNVANVIAALDSLIGQVPYDHWNADKESIFTVITVLTFRLAGVDVQTEVHSARGRCDVLVKTPDFIYVMELKLDASAREALDQIYAKNYLQPYQGDSRTKLAIGISFSSENRAVAEYLVENP